VGELVVGPLDAEVCRESEGEDEGLGCDVAAGVVADHQGRPVLWDVAEIAHLGPEPETREQPDEGKVFAYVVRVPVVEVGAEATRQRAGQRLDRPAQKPAGCPAESAGERWYPGTDSLLGSGVVTLAVRAGFVGKRAGRHRRQSKGQRQGPGEPGGDGATAR